MAKMRKAIVRRSQKIHSLDRKKIFKEWMKK
jgi:hypothetical protein